MKDLKVRVRTRVLNTDDENKPLLAATRLGLPITSPQVPVVYFSTK